MSLAIKFNFLKSGSLSSATRHVTEHFFLIAERSREPAFLLFPARKRLTLSRCTPSSVHLARLLKNVKILRCQLFCRTYDSFTSGGTKRSDNLPSDLPSLLARNQKPRHDAFLMISIIKSTSSGETRRPLRLAHHFSRFP